MNYLAFDPGFGNGKLAHVGPNGLSVTVIRSIVGLGRTDIGRLSMGDVGRQRRRRLPDQVAFDGVTYLVGDGVERYATPMAGMDFLRLRDGPALRALFYDAVFHALGAGDHEAVLLMGLPVEVMLDERQADATTQALRDWIIGSHPFAVDGETVTLTVQDVRTIAQPVGAFFAWGLDNQGRWTRGKDGLRAAVGVLDIGFNTLDLFAVEQAEIAARYTDGDTLGMRRAAEHLIQAVDEAHDMSLSLYEADAHVRAANPVLYTAQGEVDLRPLVRQALNRAASGILSFVQQPDKWGDGRQFAHLLLTGGGAETLRAQLRDQFPRGYVLPNPVAANAIGMARYARRFFGEEKRVAGSG